MRLWLREDSNEFEIVWTHSSVLKVLLRNNEAYYVDSWEGAPRDKWFYGRDPDRALILPVVYLDTCGQIPCVGVKNGWHRINWLMNQGHPEIPVGLPINQIENGFSLGLISKIAGERDQL